MAPLVTLAPWHFTCPNDHHYIVLRLATYLSVDSLYVSVVLAIEIMSLATVENIPRLLWGCPKDSKECLNLASTSLLSGHSPINHRTLKFISPERCAIPNCRFRAGVSFSQRYRLIFSPMSSTDAFIYECQDTYLFLCVDAGIGISAFLWMSVRKCFYELTCM